MAGHTLWVGLEEGVHHWRQGLEEGVGRRGGGQREMKMEVAGGIEARQRGQTTVDSYHLCT